MSEKTDVRVWVGLGASVVLLFDAIVFYFMKSELLGPLFTGNVLGNALVASLILIFRVAEGSNETNNDAVIAGVLFGVELIALAALLLNSYLSGYRMA